MKLPPKNVTVSTVFILDSIKIGEVVNCWQKAWQTDHELEALIPQEAWSIEAIQWLESNQQKEQIVNCAFWECLSKLPLTKSHWNALLLQLDNALEQCQIHAEQQEKIIESVLFIQQQYFFSKKTKHSSNELAVFYNNKFKDSTTKTPRRNSKPTIMNEEKMNYQNLLQQTVDASFCRLEYNRDGIIIDANQNIADLLLYDSIDDLIGKHVDELTEQQAETETESESESENTVFWEKLVAGQTQKVQYRYLTQTGQDIWLQSSFTPLFDENHEVTKVINIALDITKQKLEALNTEALKEAVDRSFARIEYDLNGKVVNGNTSFLLIGGELDIDSVNERNIPMFMEEEFHSSVFYGLLWKYLTNGDVHSAEYKRINSKGKEVWTSTVFAPVKDHKGNVNRVVEISTDVSNQKRFLSAVNKVIEKAGQEGKLDARLDASTAVGDWKNLASSVNLLLESIAMPVSELGEVIGLLAQRDLSVRFDSFVEGDLKDLGDELNTAIASIAHLMAQISQIGDLVAASAEEMLVKGEEMKNTTFEVASATQQMAEGAQQQAQQTDEASKMMDNVLLSVDSMAEKASKINESATVGQKNSTKGLDTIKLVVDNMGQIRESASSTSTSIEAFAERSEEIARALSVITDIASQTNLLALNAAIEAARAGDAGRGFAVVAEEIRKLAEGSRRSATEIEKVIREVHKDISMASKAIDYMEKSVGLGMDASRKAEEVFESIEESNKETLDLSNEIVGATEEQRASIHATARNIEKIVIVAEETASGTEQVANSSHVLSQGMNEVTATSEDLAKVATQLQENISKFKLPQE
ncbi:MAG: methyl-accepting chemotaxis protein [Aureispira sp.]